MISEIIENLKLLESKGIEKKDALMILLIEELKIINNK